MLELSVTVFYLHVSRYTVYPKFSSKLVKNADKSFH